jgi:cysteine-S-conjugate beta-lyase
VSEAEDREDTRLVEAGRRPEWTQGIVNVPVFHASTVLFPTLEAFDAASPAKENQLFYGRRGTPTTWSLQDALTELTPGGVGTALFPSGVAALATALLSVLRAGDHLLMVDAAYDPTRTLCDGLLRQMGIETSYYDPLAGADIVQSFRPNTRAVFVESPGSLTFEIQDIPAIAAVAHAREAFVIADNTYGGPSLYPVLSLGADISVVSLTKYVIGHSDAMMGAVTANARAWPLVKTAAGQLGQCAAPDDVFLALRGLRTLGVRLKQQSEAALALAHWLADHPEVMQVLHPALPDCPGHAVFRRDCGKPAGLFSFILKRGERHHLAAFVDGLAHFGMGYSWGGFESLILPIRPERYRTATRWTTTTPMLRISVGLEDFEDLQRDLATGLERYAAQFA